MLKEIDPGATNYMRANLSVINDTLFFTTIREVWISDGTTEGTKCIKTLPDFTNIRMRDGYSFSGHVSTPSLFYFVAQNITHLNSELWKSDGTAEGTVPVDTFYFMDYFFSAGENLYFAGKKTYNEGKLYSWVYNGTKGKSECLNLYWEDDFPIQAMDYYAFNNKVIFSAYTGPNDLEMYVTDGTPEGTESIKKDFGSDIDNFTEIKGLLYFTVDGAKTELWKTDGTAQGTSLVKEIWNSNCVNCDYNLTKVGDSLFFNDFENNLWVSDGNAEGTHMVKKLSANFREFEEFNNKLYFINNDSLYVSDGTEEGTVKAGETYFQNNSLSKNYPGKFIFGNYMLLRAYDDEHGCELWKSDGTAEGTFLLKDINTGISGTDNNNIFEFVKIFPNPVYENLNLIFSEENNAANVSVTIFNSLGINLQTLEFETYPGMLMTIPVNNYNPRYYYIVIKTNKSSVTFPFIKK